MASTYQVIVPITAEPLTLSDVRDYCRIDFTDDDNTLLTIMKNVRSYAEKVTRKALATQTIQAVINPTPPPRGMISGPVIRDYDYYPYSERQALGVVGMYSAFTELPQSPAQSVILTEYRSTPFDPWQTIDSSVYSVDNSYVPTRIYFNTSYAAFQFRITYTTGYTVLPETIKQAMLDMIAFRYNNRDGEAMPDELVHRFVEERVEYL